MNPLIGKTCATGRRTAGRASERPEMLTTSGGTRDPITGVPLRHANGGERERMVFGPVVRV